MYVKADFVTSTLMRVAHWDAMVARERQCDYIFLAKKMS
jgi:hypothetical protein